MKKSLNLEGILTVSATVSAFTGDLSGRVSCKSGRPWWGAKLTGSGTFTELEKMCRSGELK